MIFLSAGIPDPHDEEYFRTADVIAIRDAVIALTSVMVTKYKLIWGGHPAITPLIRQVLARMEVRAFQQVLLYQSLHFANEFIRDNDYFERIEYTDKMGSRADSLNELRRRMLVADEHRFIAGIFIGGKDGVEEEFRIFRDHHPQAKLFPIASTGGAARIIYEKKGFNNKELLNNYAYIDLFKSISRILEHNS
jgi:hypothetical protein